jgi:hypothetical protein
MFLVVFVFTNSSFFFISGQKFATPTPGFGDRVFYFSLLRQRPDSAMAQQWYVICIQMCTFWDACGFLL